MQIDSEEEEEEEQEDYLPLVRHPPPPHRSMPPWTTVHVRPNCVSMQSRRSCCTAPCTPSPRSHASHAMLCVVLHASCCMYSTPFVAAAAELLRANAADDCRVPLAGMELRPPAHSISSVLLRSRHAHSALHQQSSTAGRRSSLACSRRSPSMPSALRRSACAGGAHAACRPTSALKMGTFYAELSRLVVRQAWGRRSCRSSWTTQSGGSLCRNTGCARAKPRAPTISSGESKGRIQSCLSSAASGHGLPRHRSPVVIDHTQNATSETRMRAPRPLRRCTSLAAPEPV